MPAISHWIRGSHLGAVWALPCGRGPHGGGHCLRLYPGDAATGILPTAIAGACRHVWNHLPADQERRYLLWKAYRIGSQPVPVCFTLYKRFTVLCHDPDHAWLKDHPFACVRHSLKYLGDAYTRPI